MRRVEEKRMVKSVTSSDCGGRCEGTCMPPETTVGGNRTCLQAALERRDSAAAAALWQIHKSPPTSFRPIWTTCLHAFCLTMSMSPFQEGPHAWESDWKALCPAAHAHLEIKLAKPSICALPFAAASDRLARHLTGTL